MKLYMENLGCAKNRVDGEIMLGRMMAAGWEFCPFAQDADLILVNTCGFIESAAQESVNAILELAGHKTDGQCRALVVAGCLPQRYQTELAKAVPEVDAFLGTGAFDQIVPVARSLMEKPPASPVCLLPGPDTAGLQKPDTPRVMTADPFAYIKVAEGCSRRCAYCIIPALRGNQRSRPAEHVLAEAQSLIFAGKKELVLVAHETTDWGRDLSPAQRFSRLLSRVAELDKTVWVRFLYGHPNSLGEDILETVRDHDNIAPYFDIPIQHASDPVLRRMGRACSRAGLEKLLTNIRQTVENAVLRTTVMTGFPGETEADFQCLLSFIKTMRFDHLGAFAYSDGDDLAAHRLPGRVPQKTAEKRRRMVMEAQQKISFTANQNRVGAVFPVLLEQEIKPGQFTGRTIFQAPEVDGITHVHGPGLGWGKRFG